MVDLIDAAFDLQHLLDARPFRFAFIGGLAVQSWGEPRLTRYIDLSLLTGFGGEERFADALLTHYEPRMAGAKEFALAHRVLLLKAKGGIGIDVSFAALPYEERVVDRAILVELLPARALRLCSPEDLIIMKLFAGREIDLRDARSVIVRQGADRLDWDYMEHNLSALGTVKEEAGLIDVLARMRNSTQ